VRLSRICNPERQSSIYVRQTQPI